MMSSPRITTRVPPEHDAGVKAYAAGLAEGRIFVRDDGEILGLAKDGQRVHLGDKRYMLNLFAYLTKCPTPSHW